MHLPKSQRILCAGALCGSVGQVGRFTVVKHRMKSQANIAGGYLIGNDLGFDSQHVRAAGASHEVREIDQPDGCSRIAEDVIVTVDAGGLSPIRLF